MRAALVLVGLVVAVASTSAAAPAAPGADAAVFGGLGTWIDIYDGPLFVAPERTAARIAARSVKVAWVETANDRAPADVMRPAQLGRLVDELQARGVRVVAWYLPGHVKTALDVRRSLAMLRFRTAGGGASCPGQ